MGPDKDKFNRNKYFSLNFARPQKIQSERFLSVYRIAGSAISVREFVDQNPRHQEVAHRSELIWMSQED
jgi:hypothetical protein